MGRSFFSLIKKGLEKIKKSKKKKKKKRRKERKRLQSWDKLIVKPNGNVSRPVFFEIGSWGLAVSSNIHIEQIWLWSWPWTPMSRLLLHPITKRIWIFSSLYLLIYLFIYFCIR